MSDLNTWQFIQDKLGQNKTVVLLVVAASRPPAPGRAGFKMAVCEDGTLEGTIGGGSVEQEMITMAREKIRTGDSAPLVRALAHRYPPEVMEPKKESPSGMICGGGQTIVTWMARSRDMPAISRIIEDLKSGTPFRFTLTPEGIAHEPGNSLSDAGFTNPSADIFRFTENVSPATVTIIGGGHVALALSEVLSRLDFRIVVLDDRDDTPTLKNNRFAHKIQTVDYSEIADLVPEGPNTYVVIMTPTHQGDEDVLRRLIHKKFAYLGMMASPPKAKKIFGHLKDAGITEESLNKVHSPIGLPIHSHTAPEIAVSIAAEVISIKNGNKRKGDPGENL